VIELAGEALGQVEQQLELPGLSGGDVIPERELCSGARRWAKASRPN
jgi:hypothetical protein